MLDTIYSNSEISYGDKALNINNSSYLMFTMR